MVAQPPPTIGWTWNPGGYSNFVVVTSPDLAVPLPKWAVFLNASTNYFRCPITDQCRYFSLYGTNAAGNSGWCIK